MNARKKDNTDLPHIRYFDYKDLETLKKFINPHGRIVGRTYTKLPAREQRELARAVKNARYMGILPFVVS